MGADYVAVDRSIRDSWGGAFDEEAVRKKVLKNVCELLLQMSIEHEQTAQALREAVKRFGG